jgi:hypothetical protein
MKACTHRIGRGDLAGQFADAGGAVLVAEAGELSADPPIPLLVPTVTRAHRPGIAPP